MEFERKLREQISLLNDYCDLYDHGKVGHALSIAARLDVILEMLRSAEGGQFVRDHEIALISNASGPTAFSKDRGHHPLATLSVSVKVGDWKPWAEFAPICRMPDSIQTHKKMKIGAWLREAVLIANTKHRLDRAGLIKQMRNKGGGAHPYSEPEPDYKALSDKWGLGLQAVSSAGAVPYEPPATVATIRHMAHEVMVSLLDWMN